MIYAHFTDEKAEAQGTDMTYPSLRTGIQKYTSPKTASGFPKMSEIISLPLRGGGSVWPIGVCFFVDAVGFGKVCGFR